MKITRENYEIYFIDYLEGNLDEKLVDDFIEFLQNNPDLKDELSWFEPISLEPEKINFSKKEKLYKHPLDNENEFEKAAVANLEGDLSKKEVEELNLYLASHPEKYKNIELFAKTKLVADSSIIFRKKKSLYQYSVGRKIYFWSVRVAAILILVFAIFALINQKTAENIQEIMVAESVVPEILTPEKATKEQEDPAKKETVKTEKQSPKEEIKKTIPENKANKKLRENSRGRMEHNDVAQTREPIEVPAKINSLRANLQQSNTEIALAKIHQNTIDLFPEPAQERLLADVIREKTNIDEINLGKIKTAGLNLVSSFTRNNFTFETNSEGKVVEYNYDSRLLAFSIPAQHTSDAE